MAKILIVEDDASLRMAVESWLQKENYLTDSCGSGKDALHFVRTYSYDGIVLDWELPEMSGIEFLRELRASRIGTPVLMLTGKAKLVEKELGLDTGADDYLTKPFEFRELTARLRALLRRSAGSSNNTLRCGSVELCPTSLRLTIGETVIHLSPKEFAILEFLMRHPNTVFSGDTILDRVWHSDSQASSNTVRSFMYTLRKKLKAQGQENLIQTHGRAGYILIPDAKSD